MAQGPEEEKENRRPFVRPPDPQCFEQLIESEGRPSDPQFFEQLIASEEYADSQPLPSHLGPD